MPSIRSLAAAAAAVALAACGGSSSHPPSGPAPSTYPTAADAHEGASKDDTAATASTIAVGEVQHRNLFPAGDVDWVKVTLEAGPLYEISVNRLSTVTDMYAFLYAPDGVTEITHDDDYDDLDPNMVLSVNVAGTYYLKVTSYVSRGTTVRNGLGSYTLSVHRFVDADGDGWSSYYDCDDANSAIYPYATDVAGDHVDQDCDGIDAPDMTVADAFEPDGDPTHARRLAFVGGDPWEVANFRALGLGAGVRTLTPGDEDWLVFTLGAHEAAEVGAVYRGSRPNLNVYLAPDLVTPVVAGGSLWGSGVENATDTPVQVYVQFTRGAGDVYYVPIAYSLGVDLDGDGYYTRDWDGARDCDDSNPNIHPGATETPGDQVDSNCNGFDDT